MATYEEMAQSFGAAAAAYESGRPEYPAAAVEWMLRPAQVDGRVLRVVDVGAGTGKLTRAVVALGAEVVAVEPDADMLAVLQEAVPGVPTFLGTAESPPLPDAAVDAVMLGQAWHWVDVPAASRECGRVIRAGGVLGLIWNVRDESVPWVSRMTAIMHASNAETMMAGGNPPVDVPFDGLEASEWRWSRRMTRAAMTDMVRSRSYWITAEPAEQQRIDVQLGALFDELGAVGEAEIDLPYVTRAYRAMRP